MSVKFMVICTSSEWMGATRGTLNATQSYADSHEEALRTRLRWVMHPETVYGKEFIVVDVSTYEARRFRAEHSEAYAITEVTG